MRQQFLFYLIAWSISLFVFAQVAPSPDAMGAITLTSQEDLYRGYVSEVVPLYEVQAENGYKVPIQLVYQTRGVRVNEIASSVGLGWNLAAGGAITRVMRDEPDDQSEFINGSPIDGDIIAHSERDEKPGYDFQKDIFYYNFPAGAGQFVSAYVKNQGTEMTENSSESSPNTTFEGLPVTDNQIFFYRSGDTDSYWEIIDTQGVIYTFGKSEEAREVTRTITVNEEGIIPDNGVWEYISTWYLEKITFPNLPDASSIHFTYRANTGEILTHEETTVAEFDLIDDPDLDLWYYYRKDGGIYWELYTYPVSEECCSASDKECCYQFSPLMTGNWGNELPMLGLFNYNKMDQQCSEPGSECTGVPYLQFEQNLINENDYVVEELAVKAFEEDPTLKLITNQTYIKTSSLVEISSLKSTVSFSNESREDNANMAAINKMRIYSNSDNSLAGTYDFEYEYFDAADAYSDCTDAEECKRLKLASVSHNGYEIRRFNYLNETDSKLELPGRKSIKRDKYGYFKWDAYRKLERKTLKHWSIEYEGSAIPTTSYSTKYEHYIRADCDDCGDEGERDPSDYARANMLWKVHYPTGGYKEFSYSAKSSGGVKIDALQLKDENDQIVAHKTYSYSDPQQVEAPLYALGENKITLFSDSPFLTFDHMSLGGYLAVEVKDEMTEMTTHYAFEEVDIQDNSDKALWELSNDGTSWTLKEELDEGMPPLMSPAYDPRVGLVKTMIVKDAAEMDVSKVTYNRGFGNSSLDLYEYAFSQSVDRTNEYYVGTYEMEFHPFYLNSVTTTTYEDGDPITTKTSNIYHGTHKTLVKETYVESQESDIKTYDSKTILSYPSDSKDVEIVYSSQVLTDMVDANIISSPIKIEKQVKLPGYEGYKTSGISITTISEQNGFFQPYQSYSLPLSVPTEEPAGGWTNGDFELMSTKTFNSSGLLSAELGKNEVETRYSYDSEGYGYLIAKTVDPGPASLERTTSYTYKPLVGIASVTDPNLRTLTYEYDDRNRLKLVRDQDDNIVKKYQYNYAGESSSSEGDDGEVVPMEVEMYIHGYNAPSGNMYFETDVIAMTNPDAATYSWTINNESFSGKTTSYSFSASGSYPISLTIDHPEYDVYTIEESLFIYSYDWQISGAPGGNPSACDGSYYTYQISSASGANSCYPDQDYQYIWQYRYPAINWTDINEDTPGVSSLSTLAITWEPARYIGNGSDSYVELRLTVYDTCSGETRESEALEITLNENCQ